MKIVIVGGGFGGVKAALLLARNKKMSVTLISDKEHFLFYPSLYSTATGRSRQQSILPLAEVFKGSGVNVIIDTVTSIDAVRRIIVAKESQLHYDKVIFALGVVTSYFGITGLDTYSYSIKSSLEIDRFKKHLHDELIQDHHLDKNYIVVGAGPTGVELAASLTHYLATIAKKHHVRRSKIHISLVEAAPRVLPRMSERASEMVARRLLHIGVKVMTNKKVEAEEDDSITISGKEVPSKTVVWTSGVANHPFFSAHTDVFTLTKNGRVEVDDQLRAAKDIYVIGDNAATTYTGLAQTAIHDAQFISRVMKSEINHSVAPSYAAKKQPVVIPVGERWAILEYGAVRLTGIFGYFMHRAASFIGYTDYFPILTALRLWWSETLTEEECPICR